MDVSASTPGVDSSVLQELCNENAYAKGAVGDAKATAGEAKKESGEAKNAASVAVQAVVPFGVSVSEGVGPLPFWNDVRYLPFCEHIRDLPFCENVHYLFVTMFAMFIFVILKHSPSLRETPPTGAARGGYYTRAHIAGGDSRPT
jgi:hypothetical protein